MLDYPESLSDAIAQLLADPGSGDADTIVARARDVLNRWSKHTAPPWTATVVASEDEHRNLPPNCLAIPEKALDWVVLNLLRSIRAWEESPGEESAKLVKLAIFSLREAWKGAFAAAYIDRNLQGAHLDCFADTPSGLRDVLRRMALYGRVVDSGRKRAGEIVWVASLDRDSAERH